MVQFPHVGMSGGLVLDGLQAKTHVKEREPAGTQRKSNAPATSKRHRNDLDDWVNLQVL